MKIAAAAMVALALASCAGRGSLEEREAGALERQLAGRTQGEARRCVPAIQAVALIAVDARTIVYDTPGTLYVSRLRRDCPGLRAGSAIAVETGGDQYCANDRIRAVETGSRIPGPVCLLGAFTPYRSPR
ncbi:MAG TPA: hypothetical protein VF552_00795 [Allosphingosinicella sp.]|jgi:hypothetical protein